jgi:transposase
MWMIDVEEFLTLRDLFNKDLSISEIARQTGHSRVTVRKHLNSQIPPMPKKRSRKSSKMDGHREYIIDRLKEFPLFLLTAYIVRFKIGDPQGNIQL